MRSPSPTAPSISSARCGISRARQLGLQLERHLHVLRRGQRLEQVVRLEDVADAAAAPARAPRPRAAQLLAEDRRLPSCAERSAPISVSSVVFPEPDGPVHDDDLAGADLGR